MASLADYGELQTVAADHVHSRPRPERSLMKMDGLDTVAERQRFLDSEGPSLAAA